MQTPKIRRDMKDEGCGERTILSRLGNIDDSIGESTRLINSNVAINRRKWSASVICVLVELPCYVSVYILFNYF